MAKVLRNRNMDVTTAPDGAAALKLVSESEFDVVVLDGDLVIVEPRNAARDGEIVVGGAASWACCGSSQREVSGWARITKKASSAGSQNRSVAINVKGSISRYTRGKPETMNSVMRLVTSGSAR